jgi:Fe-S cluster assembly protein SufD
MSASLELYINELADTSTHAPWLLDLKQQARSDFARLGFPTKYDEDWKYTSTVPLLQHTFSKSCASDLCVGEVPAGVVVLPLYEALTSHADLIKPYFNKIMQQMHGFHAFNTAMFDDGMLIYIPEGLCVEKPIVLHHKQSQANAVTCFRHLVIAAPNSSCTVIEDYESSIDTPYFTNAVTEITLGASSTVIHGKLQCEGASAFHVSEVAVRQEENSSFESHSVSMGGQWVRSDTHITFSAPGASCVMNGMYAPTARQHMDHHTTVNHAVPGCISTQDYKGILNQRARAVFNGKVLVAKGAHHTEAKQSNKNVLLSSMAEVDTKPELQILADDVVCTHGATVGQLDEEALFYLATRGIDTVLAQHYLIQAFFADNIKNITQPDLKSRVQTLLNQHIEQHME